MTNMNITPIQLSYTHAQLCELGTSAMRRMFGCGVVASEIASYAGESPDVFGFKNSGQETYLFEVKVSRSDFIADAKKYSRQNPHKGIGLYRYYFAPAGLITVEELPQLWGLIEVDPRRKLTISHGKVPNSSLGNEFAFRERSTSDELALLYSIARRAQASQKEVSNNTR